uniref:C3H1-type domain-containing protein n=1 Tax=Leersia perrieri TaxID=77586 RepID=A0A0D9WPI7_9ORYZ
MSMKRIFCKFYKNGTCLKGDHGRFSHDWNDYEKKVCTFYQKGACSYGSHCRYDHVKVSRNPTVPPPPSLSTTTSALPLGMGRPCHLGYQAVSSNPRQQITHRVGYQEDLSSPREQISMDVSAHSGSRPPMGTEVKKNFCLKEKIYSCLLKHQRDGLHWLWNVHCSGRGGIVADDMGVGKTRQVSSFLNGLVFSGLIKRILIVTPPILINQWTQEMKFIGLIEQTSLFKDPRSRHGILENVKKELYVLLNFCCPNTFGTLEEFERNYLTLIVIGSYKESTSKELVDSSISSKKLRDFLKPYMLRRMKDDLSLPEKAELTVWLELSPYQKALYQSFLRNYRSNILETGQILVATMLLGKICNHPCRLTVPDDELEKPNERKLLKNMVKQLEQIVPQTAMNDEFYSSCKIEFILKLLEKFHNVHKVLIFSQTREMLNLIEVALAKRNYIFSRIDGTLGQTERDDIVEEFKGKDGPPILLLTTRVGGFGLDLQIACRTIIVDPSWNPSIDNQCADRTYRVGQQQKLFKSGLSKNATEDADYERYVSKNSKLLDMPSGFSTSRIQRKLVHDTMRAKRSKEVQEEIDDLKKRGFAVVSIHNRLFSETIDLPTITNDSADFAFKPKEWPAKMSPTPPIKEAENDSQSKKAFLESEIQNYRNILLTVWLPDGGEKIRVRIEELEELSKLETKDPT